METKKENRLEKIYRTIRGRVRKWLHSVYRKWHPLTQEEFDAVILENCSPTFTSAGLVVGFILFKLEMECCQSTEQSVLERIFEMEKQGLLETKPDSSNIHVRLSHHRPPFSVMTPDGMVCTDLAQLCIRKR